MAEKFMDGIGRELRYMEYKLRKKNKGKKGKQHHAGFGDQSATSSLSPEARDAIPSNQSEEALQLQIALAMSKEESDQQNKSDINDKIKLEMAIKESVEESKKSSQATAPSSDPWGGNKEAVTFEPFSFEQTPNQTQSSGFQSQQWPATNTIQATSSALSPPPKSPLKPFDPWADSSSVSTPKPQTDAWGNVVATETNPRNPDPWNTPQAPTTTPQVLTNSVDFFSTPLSSDPWGSATSNPVVDNPFLYANPDTADQPTFDPLKDFDSLHIAQPQASSTVTAVDIMKMGLHEPTLSNPSLTPVDENGNKVARASESFLGDSASLVNFDNLVAKSKPANPYLMPMNTGATLEGNSSRNPFNQKGPSISMNQMKGQAPQMAPQPFSGPVYGNIPMQAPTMGMQPRMGVMGYPGMMQNPYPVGMATGNAMPPVQSNQYGQPPNPSLF